MKLKIVLAEMAKAFWRIAAPLTAADFLLSLLFGWLMRVDILGAEFSSVFMTSIMPIFLFFYIAVTFRGAVNLGLQNGVSRECMLLCGVCFLVPTAVLLSAIHAVVTLWVRSVEDPALYVDGWLNGTETTGTLFGILLAVFTAETLRYAAEGAMFGALFYRVKRKHLYWIVPVSALLLLVFAFGRLTLSAIFAESGSVPETLYSELLYHQNSAFPLVGNCIRYTASALICGGIATLLTRGTPVQN
ncbi:MAG: hypothetical protein ACI4K8_08395 [Candidatus Fimenecus sp.]